MYEARILKKLIDDDIVEVNALLIKHRKALKISANDILVLSTLSRQEVKKNYIYSSKLVMEKTGLSQNDFFQSLEKLDNQGYVKITPGTNPKTGKQVEYYSLDSLYERITDIYLEQIKRENEEKSGSLQEKIVNLYFDTFERPIAPNEGEIIMRWIQEGQFTYEDIKNAMMDALKVGKYSLRYIDSKLIKSKLASKENKEYTDTSKIIDELSEKWKK
jgi:DNA replication protein